MGADGQEEVLNAALREFARVVLFQVNLPAGEIFNCLESLKRQLNPTGEVEVLLGLLGENTQRIVQAASELRQLVDPPRPEEVSELLDVEALVTAAVAASSPVMASTGARVVTEVEASLPRFPGPRRELAHALGALLAESARAMTLGGTVQVRASMEARPGGAWLLIEVSDEGTHRIPQLAEKALPAFLESSASDPGRGLADLRRMVQGTGGGLGLAVVKRFVDRYGGAVTVRFAPGGRGRHFCVQLPPAGCLAEGAGTDP